jgi:hypothetical protein
MAFRRYSADRRQVYIYKKGCSMLRIITLAILCALSGGLATAGQARDFKDYPENWVCAYGYNAGGRMVWVYGDTVQWKPDAISSAQRACRARSGKCVSLGCFRRL